MTTPAVAELQVRWCPPPSVRELVTLRPALDADRAFVFSSWMRSYRKSEAAKGVPGPSYYPQQQATIERLLRRCNVVIACQPELESEVLGYLIFEPLGAALVVQYVYVKHLLRRMGLATHMVEGVSRAAAASHVVFAAQTDTRSKRLMRRLGASFNPYLSR